MNHNRLIHDYLDGKLEQHRQDMLFAELSNNTELRDEFNQQMKMHMIAQNDMAMIAPPAAATNAIFSDLGFSIPPSGKGGDSGAGAGFGAAALTFLKKYLPSALLAVASAVLTGLVIYWLLDFDRGNSSNLTNANVENNSKPIVSSMEGQSVPVLPMYFRNDGLSAADVQRIVNNAMSNYMVKVNNYYKDYYTALINLSKDMNSRDEQLRQDFANVRRTPRSDFNLLRYMATNNVQKPINKNRNALLVNNSNLIPLSQTDNSAIVNPYLLADDFISNFNLSFRGFTTRNETVVQVSSQSNPWFKNMGIGVSYNIANNHEFGVEIGQEAFSQNFDRKLYGEELTYFQNPVLFWYGAKYKYSMKQLFVPNVFYPYFEIMGGFTKVGPLGRAQIGLSYSPDKRVTFNLGLEGSSLWYNVQKKIYDSKKIGLTYGVSVSY